MSTLHPHKPPASGLQGLKESWRNDLMAAFSVSMVALPLSLGIALASDAPATAGLFAALIAGIVTTFVRGSHIAINGPGNGLIAVILLGVASFGGGKEAFQVVLAAIVVAGALQTLIGLLKLGKLGDIFPSSVIHGILAAIGLIILGKQLHVALGVNTKAKTTLAILLDVTNSIQNLNPYVLAVSGVSLLILVMYPKIQNKLLHLIPAPMWVLLIAVPMAWWLSFSSAAPYTMFGKSFSLGQSFLVPIPKNLLEGFLLPDFSKWATIPFWSLVFSITLLSFIETLISANAVDKLDPYKRSTDNNRELIGVGLSSMLSGFVGGLPIVTVIARSSVNIHNHAKTRWSNFFSGVFLLVFIVLFAPIIRQVPLAALAAILVYTGYKLTNPKVFFDAHKKGWEQLLFLVVTLVATLLSNLVWGLLVGTGFTLLFHIIRTGTSPSNFMRSVWGTKVAVENSGDNNVAIHVDGVLNFANILRLQTALEKLPEKPAVTMNLSKAPLVDLTVLETIHNVAEKIRHKGGSFILEGLQHHQASSTYPQALHIQGSPVVAQAQRPLRLSRRESELQELAEEKGWTYKKEVDWDASYLKNFQFFETRPLEYKENVISGKYKENGIFWEIADLTFDEGALLVEEFHTTVQVLFMPRQLPEFVIEREELYDRLMEYVGHEDIDFKYFTDLSPHFVVKCYSKNEVDCIFNTRLIQFFENHDIYHLESNGEALLVFRRFRLERKQGIMAMHNFCQELLEELLPTLEDAGAPILQYVPPRSISRELPAVTEENTKETDAVSHDPEPAAG
jgi:MFS superfamily sulfate permease-like transporter